MHGQRLVSRVVVVLAVVQGVLGVLRAFRYFHVGAELAGQGLIVMPLLGAVVYSRGAVIVMVAFLSFIFVTGLLLSKS